MKLGKKLEVTDVKKRLKLLIDGKVFTNIDGLSLRFCIHTKTFYFDEYLFSGVEDDFIFADWYYPAEIYTINGVELVDERVTFSFIEKNKDGVDNWEQMYVSDPTKKENLIVMFHANMRYSDLVLWVGNSLVHKTPEAAIAHAKAMVIITENQ